MIKESFTDHLNPIARGLFSFGFRKGLNSNRYIPGSDLYWNVSDTIRKWKREENLSYVSEIVKNRQIILFEKDFRRRKMSMSLMDLIACHLREGYIIKEWRKEGSEMISVKLLLAWRPAVHIVRVIFKAFYVVFLNKIPQVSGLQYRASF